MIDLHSLETAHPGKIHALFGLSPKALAELLEAVLPVLLERRFQRQASRPNRKRAVGGGRKRRLKPYQEVLMTLVYLRHNVAHAVVGELFGVSADTSENTFHEVVPVLREVCPSTRWDAEKTWKRGQPSWHPDQVDRVLIDSFETPIRRPSIDKRQRQVYSGKRKRHIKTRSGNRRLNRALYQIVLTQISNQGIEKARTYFQKKVDEGKSKKHALTCLKRQIINIIWSMLKEKRAYYP